MSSVQQQQQQLHAVPSVLDHMGTLLQDATHTLLIDGWLGSNHAATNRFHVRIRTKRNS